jgi:hypothetical protein
MTRPPPDEPDPVGAARKAFGDLGETLAEVGINLKAQAALGWILRGDLEKAREALADFPPARFHALSASAAALSGLADELMAGTGGA